MGKATKGLLIGGLTGAAIGITMKTRNNRDEDGGAAKLSERLPEFKAKAGALADQAVERVKEVDLRAKAEEVKHLAGEVKHRAEGIRKGADAALTDQAPDDAGVADATDGAEAAVKAEATTGEKADTDGS